MFCTFSNTLIPVNCLLLPPFKSGSLYKLIQMMKTKQEVIFMKKAKSETPASSRKIRPAMTPEARENQLISLAVDLAEKQLLEGTASSQVITHYLKLGSTKERIEKEKLELETELVKAKTESLKAQQRSEEMYEAAIEAMRIYSGRGNDDDED